ncbi:MAG: S9 family peptidase [Ferruginibacter sp.]|nr:S9 family peptidase [Ferruginibacter sp.]
MNNFKGYLWVILIFITISIQAQNSGINWTKDGLGFYSWSSGNLIKIDPVTKAEVVVVKKEQLIPAGTNVALNPQSFSFSSDNNKILLFVNTAKVWRYKTKGDYWVLDISKKSLRKLGQGLPAQSLMFAKFSPDGKKVAYVSNRNIYYEDLDAVVVRQLTSDGTRKMINGTFDWVYEEEFGCRDGFRWSPDGKQIAFWQIDANKIRDFYMINNTDSVYSRVIPVEYPKVGQSPSPARIGVITLSNVTLKWMRLEGDPSQYYIPRMEWSGSNELIVQQLDRKQQESKLIYCNANDGSTATFWAENDDAWVDLNTSNPAGWNWINGGKDFLWVSEKDGWRHIYKISRDGNNIVLLTKGNYDIDEIKAIDEKNNYVYFSASPDNATQLYLYRVKMNIDAKQSKNDLELLPNQSLKGTHTYDISPFARFAKHSFSNYKTPPVEEWVGFPDGKALKSSAGIEKSAVTDNNMNVNYLKLTTDENIELDAWINKPLNFNPQKKYPVVFYVYGEPAASTVKDEYGNHDNFLYDGSLSAEGYIQVGIDNRGTPSLKGAKWRKAIYRKNGQINIRDMAKGFKRILELPYVDKDRTVVWGWSGGGSSTLNLMFQNPDLFKAGVSIAPITNLLYYDNIYTERYMGLPQENMDDFIKGSAVTHAKGLKGKLLLVHGTGDDNVHYSNAEGLINELIKYNKQFQFMSYPNRTHSISEGNGTREHLSKLYSDFIRANCPAGAK